MLACSRIATEEEELGREPAPSTSRSCLASCPRIRGTAARPHHTVASSGHVLSQGPSWVSRASFCAIVFSYWNLETLQKCLSLSSYMEIVAKQVLVWGKVISFLQGREPGFPERGCIVGSQCVPPRSVCW